jgi:hypothetical protein
MDLRMITVQELNSYPAATDYLRAEFVPSAQLLVL